MRCLHILPMDKLSGAEKMALILCRNTKRYETIVVCGGENLKQVFEKDNIRSYTLSFDSKSFLKDIKGLKKIIIENKVRILHAHDNYASLYAYFVKSLYRLDIKVISHIHSCYPWLKGAGINKKIDSYFRKRYDVNIACGKLVYEYYRGNAGYFQTEKTSILSNAVDMEEIIKYNDIPSEEVRKKFNIPNNKIILGFVGRICEIKGIVPFVREISRYKDNFKECRVLLVGSGDQEEEAKRLINELGLEELFILTGFQNNIYEFYPLIDIFFLPSLYEGLPMVILEAMAFKKPVVSMDVGGISEVVINKENGLLVKVEDYSAFIKAILELVDSEQLRLSYGNNAYNKVCRNYSIGTYVSNIEEIYDNLK